MNPLSVPARNALVGVLSGVLLMAAGSAVAQVGHWTWQRGASDSSAASGAGIYGSQGVAAPGNLPGARSESVSWRDASGNAWLFGGQGYAETGSGLLNDLWRWDGLNWTWMSGSNGVNQQGTYGTLGQASPTNVPGARTGAVSWFDGSNLWLLGGYGHAASGRGFLNDLWKWNGTAWTWVSGSDGTYQAGNYGTRGVSAPSNVPGAREKAVAWTDSSGNLWLFGGFGRAASGTGYLNDLWRWNGTSWAWMSGSNSAYPSAVYGSKGFPAGTNAPGGRQDGVSWVDAAGNFWLFGGYGATATWGGDLSDLWMWDGTDWTWMDGSTEPMQPGIYGSKGSTSPSNAPGARENAVSWVDGSGKLWLHGGYGYTEGGFGRLNDLWRWDGRFWTWVSGTEGTDAPGVYGTEGVAAPANVPGARVDAVSWIDDSGKLWLLGGSGVDGAGVAGHLGDLWSFVPPTIPSLLPMGTPIVVGQTMELAGSGFTAGSVLNVYVATATGAQGYGPFTPVAQSPTTLTWAVPPTIPLGNGFGTVQVVNTDQGYTESNPEGQLLYGDAADNIPTITAVNGVSLNAANPSTPVANVSTLVLPGATVTLTGTGLNNALVNLFTATGNVGPLAPLPGASATQIQVVVPGGTPTGPGSFQAVNAPYTGNVQSNAVSVPIGALVTISGVSVNGTTVTVDGTGFCPLTVINLFNDLGGGNVVNLGGLNGDGSPRIPLTIVGSTQLTFQKPAGAAEGAAYVQALNPPFIPYSSSGNDPDGAFDMP